ncbi:MAG: xanthine dehydrogenase family protein molybdopterin-binding subunit, partial [Steroidobacteraceae bacterium]
IDVAYGRGKGQKFDEYRRLRVNEIPAIEVQLIDSTEKPGGMGEPAVALVAPAVCNAIYAANRKRVRALPLMKQGFTV